MMLSIPNMVKEVQKALAEGRWEIRKARKKEQGKKKRESERGVREKTPPALTKNRTHRGHEFPPTSKDVIW